MKIIKYLTPKKIPRGRSKTNHQLKFQHQQIFKNNRRPQFYKRKLYHQILMDKYPHQLAKQCQHNSEEFRKFVNRLLYEVHQKSTYKITENQKNINKLTNFREGANKTSNNESTKNNSSKHSKTSSPYKKILYQYNSTNQFLHQHINNSKQQSNAENQMK
jgi:hypothetical protein